MFTGIIEGKGRVVESRPSGRGLVFGITTDFPFTAPKLGESIAVNGVCLTAKEFSGNIIYADVSPESLARTNLGSIKIGSQVNIERALKLSDRLGGHLVSGHVDGVCEMISKESHGSFTIFTFAVPQGIDRYIIKKGSITVDGVSLTVNTCGAGFFSVSVIPHTLEVTILGNLAIGGRVNFEVDMVGKYIESLLVNDSGDGSKPPISVAFLSEHGFLK